MAAALWLQFEQTLFWCRTFLVLFCLLDLSSCIPWSKLDFPNPRLDVKKCNREVPSYLCDPGGILNKEEAKRIDSALMDIRNRTGCPCKHCTPSKYGYVTSVAIVDHIDKPVDSPTSIFIEDFGDYLRRKRWRFGKCEEDILIVLATGESELYTSRGKRVRRHLSDDIIEQIFHTNRKTFNKHQFADGLINTIKLYRQVLNGNYDYLNAMYAANRMGMIIAIICIIIAFIVVLAIVVVRMLGPRLRTTSRRVSKAASASPAMSWPGKRGMRGMMGGGGGGGGNGGTML